MKVLIVGQGYVGLPLAIELLKAGVQVLGYDKNVEKVKNIASGIIPLERNELKLLKAKIDSGDYVISSIPDNVGDVDVAVIAVPTPLTDLGKPDLSYVEEACRTLNKKLAKPALVINESTSYPGTLREFIMPRINEFKHHFAVAPERIDPGNKDWSITNTPRLVAGLTEVATKEVLDFYSLICKEVIPVSSPEIAEAAKLMENIFRSVNIGLVNEMAIIFRELNLSAHEVIEAASTKPYGFMKFIPGVGVGGHCIPVDPSYLDYKAEKLGVGSEFIKLSLKTNLSMPGYIIRKIEEDFGGSLEGRRIQVVGLSYKKDINDVRESPAIRLILELRNSGAEVIWSDPIVENWQNESTQSLRSDIDLGIIVTPHSCMDFSEWKLSKVKVIDLSATSLNLGWEKYF